MLKQVKVNNRYLKNQPKILYSICSYKNNVMFMCNFIIFWEQNFEISYYNLFLHS